MKRTSILLFCLLVVYTAFAQKPTSVDKRLAGLDTAMTRYLRDWHAAGCAVAVVEKNKVLLSTGYGFRDYEKKLPVTDNTLFAIGSSTKAFTATLLGMLVKDGKLDLDKPVHDYLPELVFYNEYLTNHVTPRDMMTHRTGLPRHDLTWYGATTPRDSLLYRIRFLEPTTELRQGWQYNNLMYLAQGLLAEKLYGKKWEEIVREKIFQPLNMQQSNFSITDLQKAADHSKGYNNDDSITSSDYMNIDAIGPAGSINSSAREMANWALAWVNTGKFDGKNVIPAGYVSQAIAAQTAMGAGSPSKETPDVFGMGYGFGWMISSYRGHYQVEHGGNIDGFSASVAFYPSDSVGIVVLTNQNGSILPDVVRNVIADRMLGLPYRNWNKIRLDAYKKSRLPSSIKPTDDSTTHKYNTHPSHALTDYTGVFNNPGYGSAAVTLRNDTLWIAYNDTDGKVYLHHYHYDIFSIRSTEAPASDNMKVKFVTDDRGDISSFETRLEPSLKEIVFTKQAVSIDVQKSELEKYVGEYVLGNVTAKIYLRSDNVLMLYVPGQPDYELNPVKKNEFDLKAVKGYSVRFEVNDKNEATAVNFVQPNGTFKATRKK